MVLPSAIIKISSFLPVHCCEHKINKNENNQDYFFFLFFFKIFIPLSMLTWGAVECILPVFIRHWIKLEKGKNQLITWPKLQLTSVYYHGVSTIIPDCLLPRGLYIREKTSTTCLDYLPILISTDNHWQTFWILSQSSLLASCLLIPFEGHMYIFKNRSFLGRGFWQALTYFNL